MAVQTSYGYTTAKGVAGGIFDMSPYEANSFAMGEKTFFGMYVARDTSKENTVKLAASAADVAKGEGIVLWRSHEVDADGATYLSAKETASVMRYGRCWAKVALGANETIAAGDAVYVITSGENKGCLTNASTDNTAVSNAKFIGANDGALAPVELAFN